MAVDVPFDSKAIAPPKVAIDGPFHQDPAPVNVELVNENFPEPTISINPPANVNFEPVAVNVDESTLRSLSLLTIAPPLIDIEFSIFNRCCCMTHRYGSTSIK